MVLRGMVLVSGLNVAKAVAAFTLSVVIAGVVAPEQFGLVTFAIALMAFLTLATDLGLTSAIVRHPELDRRQAGSAVALLGLAGLLGGCAMLLGASPMERALSMPDLASVLAGFALVTACSVWATAPRALLERALSYSRIVAVEALALVAALSAFGVAIMDGADIGALVTYHVVLQAIRALAFTWLARQSYRLSLDFGSISTLVQVGGWVFATNLLAYCARNIDRVLIGAVLGAASLGLYGLAYQFMTMPLMLIAWPVSGVLLSTLARMSAHSADKPRVVCAVITGTASFTLPLMTFLLFGVAYPIELFFAGRWDGINELIMMLAPVGAVQAIAVYHSAVLVEKGAVMLNFCLGLLNGVVLSGVFLTTVWFGLTTLVIGYVIAALAVSVTMIYYMCREAGISLASLLQCFVPGATAAVAGTGAAVLLGVLEADSTGQWALAACGYVASVLMVLAAQRARLMASAQTLIGARVTLATPQ